MADRGGCLEARALGGGAILIMQAARLMNSFAVAVVKMVAVPTVVSINLSCNLSYIKYVLLG